MIIAQGKPHPDDLFEAKELLKVEIYGMFVVGRFCKWNKGGA